MKSQDYTPKRHTLIKVLPPCKSFCLVCANMFIRDCTYMHDHTTNTFWILFLAIHSQYYYDSRYVEGVNTFWVCKPLEYTVEPHKQPTALSSRFKLTAIVFYDCLYRNYSLAALPKQPPRFNSQKFQTP